MARDDAPWFRGGLRFSCTRCGHCCRRDGHVWVSYPEIEAIASHLGLDSDAFGRRFLRRVGMRLSLVDKPNRDCVFWEEGCTIYAVRPGQCRTFPFWTENLGRAEAWAETGRECKGVGEGRLYSRHEIESLRRGCGATAAEGDEEA